MDVLIFFFLLKVALGFPHPLGTSAEADPRGATSTKAADPLENWSCLSKTPANLNGNDDGASDFNDATMATSARACLHVQNFTVQRLVGGEKVEVGHFYVPANYVQNEEAQGLVSSDVAIAVLKESFSDKFEQPPICLPATSEQTSEAECRAIEVVITDHQSSRRQLQISPIAMHSCHPTLQNMEYIRNMMCASRAHKPENIGGPILCRMPHSSRYYISGIESMSVTDPKVITITDLAEGGCYWWLRAFISSEKAENFDRCIVRRPYEEGEACERPYNS